jgi:hypothetical protein
VRTTRFWDNAQNRKIAKSNNLKVFGSYKPKGHKQDSQNRLWSSMPEREQNLNFDKNYIFKNCKSFIRIKEFINSVDVNVALYIQINLTRETYLSF